MGEKKQLREELALAHENHNSLEQENQRLARDLRDLTNQIESGAGTFRMLTDAPASPTREKIALALGIDPTSHAGPISDEMILEAVERLRNPHHDLDAGDALMVHKKDSLAEAIRHNKDERSELDRGLTQARRIVGQLAGALQVGAWNPDGDEILEKAQRFANFAYWLRKRLHVAMNAGGVQTEEDKIREDEIVQTLTVLLADKDLARLLQNKPVKVSKDLLALAESSAPTGNTYLDRPFDREDIAYLRDALTGLDLKIKASENGAVRVTQLSLVFDRLVANASACAELAEWFNAVVLPLLRKAHPAYALKEN